MSLHYQPLTAVGRGQLEVTKKMFKHSTNMPGLQLNLKKIQVSTKMNYLFFREE